MKSGAKKLSTKIILRISTALVLLSITLCAVFTWQLFKVRDLTVLQVEKLTMERIKSMDEDGKKEIQNFREELLSRKKEYIKSQVQTAMSVIEAGYAELSEITEYDEEKIKKNIARIIKGLRYGPGNEDYFWINDMHPNMIMHPYKSKLDGTDISGFADPNGKHLFVEMVKICKKNGEGFVDYYWPKYGADEPQPKFSFVKLFKKWEWIVGTGLYIDDIDALLDKKKKKLAKKGTALEIEMNQEIKNIKNRTTKKVRNMILLIAVVTLILLAAIIALSYLFVRRDIAKPVLYLSNMTRRLTDLDLRIDIQSDRKDEIGDLMRGIDNMLKSFRNVLDKVQRSVIQVNSACTEFSATSREQEATMKTQMESTRNMVKSVENISAISGRLVSTMKDVAAMLQETAKQASASQNDLSGMGDAMERMENASGAIAGRLGTISEKAENITDVVTTITKVSEQTNLLSLNAAIEAEKAGEYGRGFTVVAREIRRLADQTAVATLDIDQMVKEMQGAVSGGVMEMDSFSAQVTHSTENISKIGEQLSGIIEQVKMLSPRFEEVNKGVETQSENAQKISAAIESVGDDMRQLIESIEESFEAIRQLDKTAKILQDEVLAFKIDREENPQKNTTETNSESENTYKFPN